MPRKSFSGSRMAADAARLIEADRVAPPDAQPCLMDAVRQFSEFIDTRAAARWTATAIAAALTAAGYPIDAATLRSYRKRLRDERGNTGITAPATPLPALQRPDPVPVVHPDVSTVVPQPPRPPSSGPPAARPRFTIDETDLPPDRA